MSSSSTSTCAWSTSARCRPAPRWRCASSPIPIWWWRWRRSRSSTDRSLAQANRVAQEPAEARATASPGYAVPLDGPETLHEATDRHLPLHAGQPHARAGVDADAEGQVPVGVPTDVEPVRIGELGRIAVGRSDADVHVGTGGHLDAVQHRVSCGSAVAELVRALEAEKLLHGGADEVRVRPQGGQRVRVAEQQVHRVADQVGGGLVPGIEQEDAVVQQLELAEPLVGRAPGSQRAARGQLGENLALVVARLSPTARDEIPQVGLELVDGAVAALALLRGQHRLKPTQDGERPVAQRAPLALGHPQHVTYQLDRDGRGEVRDQVHSAASGRAIEHAVYEGVDGGLQRHQRPRGERGGEQLADPTVIRRVVEDEAGGVVLIEDALSHAGPEVHRLVRAPRLVVAIHRGAIVVAAQEVGAVRHAMNRGVLAQSSVDRVRIVQKCRVEPLEIEAEGHRPRIGQRMPPTMNCQTPSGASQWALGPTPAKSCAAGSIRCICSSVTIGSRSPAASRSGTAARRSRPAIEGPTAPYARGSMATWNRPSTAITPAAAVADDWSASPARPEIRR